ncbi:MAG: hypothetical protein QM778_16315 [Myxococcales bacterium]
MAPNLSLPVSVLYSGDGVIVGEVGPLCVVIWRDEVTRERFEQQRMGLERVVRKHRPNAAFVCVVEADTKPPSEELRKASTQMLEGFQSDLACTAGVIEGAGFKAALTRSVLSGITLLVRNRKSPVSYFATVSEATAWIATHMPIDPLALSRHVENLRAQLAPKLQQVSER